LTNDVFERPLRNAIVVMVAVLASFGATYALCVDVGVGPSPAILAATLAIGSMRRSEELSARGLLRRLIALPLLALAAGLVGLAFLRVPILGAALFCIAIFLSVYLRKFGDGAAGIGRTIALPMLALLVVPVAIHARAGLLVSGLLVVGAGVIAVCFASALQYAARRMRLLSLKSVAAHVPPRKPQGAAKGALPISTRMALQMLAALVLAFVVGMSVFREHWPWVVLTAFIVCSGAIGRGDAIYKCLLRLMGAIGGSFVASLATLLTFPNQETYAALVFVVLFVGIWLRPINYAYWAACATVIFALLQGSHGAGALVLFAARLAAIVVGVLCAIAATWFVYPLRTEQVIRRRVADALAAMVPIAAGDAGAMDGSQRLAVLNAHAERLERVAPPMRLHRAIFCRQGEPEHPAALIDRTHALLAQARNPEVDRAKLGAELRLLGRSLRGPRAGENASGPKSEA
jgi:hypothetical protein